MTLLFPVKRGLQLSLEDFRQQSRLHRHILSLFCWHVTSAMVWARKPNAFPQIKVPNGKCGARNISIYFIVVLFYSTGQSSSSDALFYSIGLRSLYVDQGLIRQHRSFLFVLQWGKYIKWPFGLNEPYAWASIAFQWETERARANVMQDLAKERRLNDAKHIRKNHKVAVCDHFKPSVSFET